MGKKISFSERAKIELKKTTRGTFIALFTCVFAAVISRHYDLISSELLNLLIYSPFSAFVIIGIIFACLGISATLYLMSALTKDIETLPGKIDEGVDKIVKAIENLGSTSSNPSHNNPNTPRNNPNSEEEVKTSGTGALAGMIAGGAIGLLFGPAGVMIGGLLGAAVGNQREYNKELERKKKK